jgi:hypothetical protein
MPEETRRKTSEEEMRRRAARGSNVLGGEQMGNAATGTKTLLGQ